MVPHTQWLGRGKWRGFLAADHVNFFTSLTIRHTVERAGYQVRFVGSPSLPGAPTLIARLAGHVGPLLSVEAQPIPNWDYPPKSLKRLVHDRVVTTAGNDT
jgi:hypothetical protein